MSRNRFDWAMYRLAISPRLGRARMIPQGRASRSEGRSRPRPSSPLRGAAARPLLLILQVARESRLYFLTTSGRFPYTLARDRLAWATPVLPVRPGRLCLDIGARIRGECPADRS